MEKTDELLQIIEGGDPARILSEDDLVQRLNFLLKYQLVTITEDRIYLTEKGREARIKGINSIIGAEDLNKELSEFPENKKNSKEKNVWELFFRRFKKNNLS